MAVSLSRSTARVNVLAAVLGSIGTGLHLRHGILSSGEADSGRERPGPDADLKVRTTRSKSLAAEGSCGLSRSQAYLRLPGFGEVCAAEAWRNFLVGGVAIQCGNED